MVVTSWQAIPLMADVRYGSRGGRVHASFLEMILLVALRAGLHLGSLPAGRARASGSAGRRQELVRAWTDPPPTDFARPMSSGRSPTIHETVRSRLSVRAAAFAMPGAGLRPSLAQA